MRRSFFVLFLILLATAALWGQIARPADAVDEGEPELVADYVDTYNGGCLAAVSYTLPISSGDIYWGESGTFDVGGVPTNDFDYYQITLTEAGTITWQVSANFDFTISIFEADVDNCPVLPAIAQTAGTTFDTEFISTNQPAGTYLLRVECDGGTPVGATYAAECYVTNLEIVSIETDLPNMNTETAFPDYFANYAQYHTIDVTIANNGHYATENARVWLYRNETTTIGSLPVGFIAPDDEVVISFPISEGFSPVVDSYFVDFGEVEGAHDTVYAMGSTYSFDPIYVQVQEPATINIDNVDLDPATCNNAPFVTVGQEFNLRVTITNSGHSTIRDLTINTENFSTIGINSTFAPVTAIPDTNHPGMTTWEYMIPVIADTDPGNIGALDEQFLVDIDAIDLNDLGAVPVTITNDQEWIGIQNPPELSYVRFETASLYDDYWLNATDAFDFTLTLENAEGDYATAGELETQDAYLELIGSIVGGIDGLDIHTVIPAAPADMVDAGDSAIYNFTLNSVGATENTIVDASFTAHYTNECLAPGTEADDSPFNVLIEDAFGIDVRPPIIETTMPSLAEHPSWPVDNTLKFRSSDNFSGVDEVSFWLRNAAGEYWSRLLDTWIVGPPQIYTATWFDDPDTLITDMWTYTMINHPDLSTESFVIEAWATDAAGNISATFRTPIGDEVNFLHVIDVYSNLPKWMDDPETAGYEYEADYNQVHTVTVEVLNPSDLDIHDAEIDLASIFGDETVIVNTVPAPPTIAPDEVVLLEYEVTELASSVIDSLYPKLVGGIDDDGVPVGLEISEGLHSIRIKVEEPVVFSIESLWVDNTTAPNYRNGDVDYDDGTFVTIGQQFDIKARVTITGEDEVDSVRIKLFNEQVAGSGVVSSILTSDEITFRAWTPDPATRYDEAIVTWTIRADPSDFGYASKAIDERFWCEIDFNDYAQIYKKADNWNFTELDTTHGDTDDSVGVQAPPLLDNFGNMTFIGHMFGGQYWVNANPDNDVVCMLDVENEDDGTTTPDRSDRAIADQLLDYSRIHSSMMLLDDGYDRIHGIDGDEEIELMDPDLGMPWAIEPLDIDMMQWTLSWDGITPIYEGDAWAACSIFYHDNNKPLTDLYATTSPLYYIIGSKVAIDLHDAEVLDAWVSIPDVPEGYRRRHFQHFPEEVTARVGDFGHAVPYFINEVEMSITSHRGNFWDGSDWVGYEVWVPMHHTDLDTYRVALGDPDTNGLYSVNVRAYDQAGNEPDVEFWGSFTFKYDNICPETEITHPDAGFYTFNPLLGNDWNRQIEVEAADVVPAIPLFDETATSGVMNTYVSIHDTLRDKWWQDGLGWVSIVWYWNECEYDPLGGVWTYDGYSSMEEPAVLEIRSYARDSSRNVCGYDDFERYIVVDNEEPVVTLFDAYYFTSSFCYFTCETWEGAMGNYIQGVVNDSILHVDDVKLTVRNLNTDMYWDDAELDPSFSSETEHWFDIDDFYNEDYPAWTAYSADPPNLYTEDSEVIIWSETGFRYYMECPFPDDAGSIEICAKATDDLGNTSTECTIYCIDNLAPTMEAVFPHEGEVVLMPYWSVHDTFKIDVEDFMNEECPCDVCGLSVRMRITRMSDYRIWMETFGGDGLWVTPPDGYDDVRLDCVNYYGDTWGYHNPHLPMATGQYHVKFVAEDCIGNIATKQWTFVINTEDIPGFLTLQTPPNAEGHMVRHVGEVFPITTYVYDRPDHVDSTFYWPILFGANMPAEDVNLPVPSPLSNGTGTFDVSVDRTGSVSFWCEVDEGGPEYARAWTVPVTIVDDIPTDFAMDVLEVAPDQGDHVQIQHEEPVADAEYTYYYQNDLGVWVEIAPVLEDITGGIHTVTFDFATFAGVEFDAAITYGIKVALDYPAIPGFTDETEILTVGTNHAVDEYAPLPLADLDIAWIPGTEDVRLTWADIANGENPDDGSILPEFMPDEYMTYDVYRSTAPYSGYATIATGLTVTTYTDETVSANLQNYYYYVVPHDRDLTSSALLEDQHLVGKFDKDVGIDYGYPSNNGWTYNSVPLDVNGIANTGDFMTNYLDAPERGIFVHDATTGWYDYHLMNPVAIGTPIALPAYTARFTAKSGVEKRITMVGDVPAEGTIAFDVEPGNFGNLITVPLQKTHITSAVDLYNDLVAAGLDVVSIDRIVEQLVIAGGVPIPATDFEVRPGDCYMVSVNAPGTYEKKAEARSHGIEAKGMVLPEVCSVHGTMEGEYDVRAYLANSPENVIDADIVDDFFRVQVSHFGEIWTDGDVVVIEFISNDGSAAITEVELTGAPQIDIGKVDVNGTTEKPSEFYLMENSPNPFNAATKINFAVPYDCIANLTVFDVKGQPVKQLLNRNVTAGEYSVNWNGADEMGKTVPTGVYFYKLQAGSYSNTRRMMLVK